MALRPGTRLGPYAIESLIGSGGMGEVYRAVDTRLQRHVAIKVLPDELSASTAATERFQREARTASLLNHPNICTIYDVGVDPPFIAMELLEGESLHHRLHRGRLDVPSLVAIALQVRKGWKRRTVMGSSTAISSRPTSSSPRMARSCSTSASRKRT